VQLLVDNRSDSTKILGATIRFMVFNSLTILCICSHLLDNKAFDSIDARYNHEDYIKKMSF